jgi:hypothetical protein
MCKKSKNKFLKIFLKIFYFILLFFLLILFTYFTYFYLIYFFSFRNYAVLCENRRFKPTTVGNALIYSYDKMNIKIIRPKNRAEMEQKIMKVAKGELTADLVYNELLEEIKKAYFFTMDVQTGLLEYLNLFWIKVGGGNNNNIYNN